MKAIVYTKYGSPDVLNLKEVEKPIPKDNEVLIKVHASSINAADRANMTGKPFLVRMMMGGIIKPKNTILGSDIAGRVEAVGRNVKTFHCGDAVFGDLSDCGGGAFAEYACVPEDVLVIKPANITFEEAAAVPLAAVTALQGLRHKRQIQIGQKVLINGASSGVGMFAVQIAKAFGADVTAIASTKKLEMVHSIGADHVIDYTQEDVTQNGKRYDFIFDAAAYRSVSVYKHSLTEDGMYLLVGGAMSRIIQVMFNRSKKIDNLMAKQSREDLTFMGELLETGKVKPFIDKCYPLSKVADAMRYVEARHVQGKVVIQV